MNEINIDDLANVTGGAGGRQNPAAGSLKPINRKGISQDELFRALIDPIANVGPMMKKHPGLPVAQETLDAVRNMGVPSQLPQ